MNTQLFSPLLKGRCRAQRDRGVVKAALVVIAIAFIVQQCAADDVYLKNGEIIRNVKIIGQSVKFGNLSLDFIFNGNETYIGMESVEKTVPSPYNENALSRRDKPQSLQQAQTSQDSISIMWQMLKSQQQQQPVLIKKQYEYPNLNWLGIAALSFGLGWDFFSRAADTQDAIDAYKSIGANTDRLEGSKSRMSVLGVVSLGVGLFSTIHALERVEIKTDGKSLSLAVQL